MACFKIVWKLDRLVKHGGREYGVRSIAQALSIAYQKKEPQIDHEKMNDPRLCHQANEAGTIESHAAIQLDADAAAPAFESGSANRFRHDAVAIEMPLSSMLN